MVSMLRYFGNSVKLWNEILVVILFGILRVGIVRFAIWISL
jgi:hypothetical protein